MLSHKDLKTILEKNGKRYKDEEINLIRDFLYFLAKLSFLDYYRKNRKE
jgi:DNA-directed RNA polymerase subunit F